MACTNPNHGLRHRAGCLRRLSSALLAGLVLLAPLAARGQALEPVTVHQKWYHSFQFAGFHAAWMQGFYAEAGLEVELREGLPGGRSLQALLEGEADFAVVGPEALVDYHSGRPLIQVEVAELGHLNTSRLLRMSQAMREAGLIDAPLRPMDDFVWQPRGDPAGRLLVALAATAMLGLLASVFFLGWNRQLKRRVRQRTRQLTQQIDRREKTEFAYRQLVENSVQGMLIHTSEALIFANRRFCQMTGYERDEILAMSPGELVERCVHPDDRAAVQKHLRERLDDVHAGQHNVFRSIRRDGQIRHLEIFSSKVDFESKPALQSTFIDVTERVRAERGMQRRLGVERMLARQSAALLQASAEELGDHLQPGLFMTRA